MKHSLPFILVALMLLACKPQVPKQYIQPDEMEDILYDYHVSQAMGKTEYGGNSDYERNRLFQAVLKKHHITEAEFDSSLVYYYSRLDRFQIIYQHVNNRLADEAKGLGAAVGEMNRYAQYSQSGDTANIWTQATSMLLIPRPTMNRFDFVVKADSTFKLGDSFTFQFLNEQIWQNGSKDVIICIRTAYEGDSIIQTVNHISAAGIAQMQIPSNHTLKIKDMRGFIYLNGGTEKSESRQMMFLNHIQLIRFHHKEIQNAHETVKQDTIKKDSVQRIVDSPRLVADTASAHPVGQGLRSKSAPFRRGGASDRVVSGENIIKSR
jgi:hypothetical protein